MIIKKLIDTYYDANNNCKYTKLCGITFLKRKITMRGEKWRFPQISLLFKSIESLSFTSVVDYIVKQQPMFDEYFIFNSNLGETFLLMFYMHEIIQKNKLNNCLYVFNNKELEILFNNFNKNLPTLTIKMTPIMNDYIESKMIHYKNKRLIFPFYTKYFIKTEKNIVTKKEHFFQILKKQNNIEMKQCKKPDIIVPDNTIYSTYRSLLGRKFVILMTETTSSLPLEKKFWDKLVIRLKNIGYNIFLNVVSNKNKLDGTITFPITLLEMQKLATESEAIIGLRSGAFDIVLPYAKNIHAIYTPFPKRGKFKFMKSEDVLTGFSLKHIEIDNNAHIYEYDVNAYESYNGIVDNIIEDIVIGSEHE